MSWQCLSRCVSTSMYRDKTNADRKDRTSFSSSTRSERRSLGRIARWSTSSSSSPAPANGSSSWNRRCARPRRPSRGRCRTKRGIGEPFATNSSRTSAASRRSSLKSAAGSQRSSGTLTPTTASCSTWTPALPHQRAIHRPNRASRCLVTTTRRLHVPTRPNLRLVADGGAMVATTIAIRLNRSGDPSKTSDFRASVATTSPQAELPARCRPLTNAESVGVTARRIR